MAYLDPSNESLGSLQQNAAIHTNWRDGFAGAFSAGVDDIDWSKREIGDDGRVEVTMMDAVMGRSQPELQAAYEAHRQRQIKNAAGQDYRETFGTTLQIDHTTDLGEVQADISDEKTRKEQVAPYLQTLATTKGGAEVLARLGPNPSLADVQREVAALTTTNTEAAEGKADKRYNDTQALNVMQMQLSQQNTQADREFRRAQTALDNRRLDMQEARQDRRDRKESIAQMMAGLSQLGASLAI